MVSFRFHLVSLVAVFLALALGIGMGVTVIDKATVDLLQNRLDGVRQDVNQANQRSSQLQTQLDQAGAFTESANQYLVQDRLDRVSVTILRVQGINTTPLDQLVQAVQSAGGSITGTITINDRMALGGNDDISDLGQALGVTSSEPSVLRSAFVGRLSAALAGTSSGSSLDALVQNGFLTWSSGQGGRDLDETEFGPSRLVLASGTGASVPDNDLAVPLLRSLASAPSRRVVAVESAQAASGSTAEIRAAFVGPVRDDRDVRDQVSSVDDLERPAGRTAAVLALAQLGDGRTGHYGVAGSASASLPPPAS